MSIVKEGVSNLNLVGYMNWNLLWHSSGIKNRHYSYFYKDKAYVTIKDRVFI